jgi:hypothetical protein
LDALHRSLLPARRESRGPVLGAAKNASTLHVERLSRQHESYFRRPLEIYALTRLALKLSSEIPAPQPRTAFWQPCWISETSELRLEADPSLDECKVEVLPPDAHRGRLQRPWGYTGKSGRAKRPYFTGLSRSCFKVAEREGFSARVRRTSKTAVKSAFPDNLGGLRVPPVCTGADR